MPDTVYALETDANNLKFLTPVVTGEPTKPSVFLDQNFRTVSSLLTAHATALATKADAAATTAALAGKASQAALNAIGETVAGKATPAQVASAVAAITPASIGAFPAAGGVITDADGGSVQLTPYEITLINSSGNPTASLDGNGVETAAINGSSGRPLTVYAETTNFENPAFAPTPSSTDNSTRLATTAFVKAASLSLNGGTLQGPLRLFGLSFLRDHNNSPLITEEMLAKIHGAIPTESLNFDDNAPDPTYYLPSHVVLPFDTKFRADGEVVGFSVVPGNNPALLINGAKAAGPGFVPVRPPGSATFTNYLGVPEAAVYAEDGQTDFLFVSFPTGAYDPRVVRYVPTASSPPWSGTITYMDQGGTAYWLYVSNGLIVGNEPVGA